MKNGRFSLHLEGLGPVLVTGHTGFKGTWLIMLLDRLGIEVSGFSHYPLENSMFTRLNLEGKFPEQFGDLRDTRMLSEFINKQKPKTVIHLAAQALVLKSYEDPIETFDVNVMGTAHLISQAINSEAVNCIGIATTDKVYDNRESGKAFLETDPLFGKDPYSASKVGTEAVVSAWQQISREKKGPSICALRAGNVIGGGDFAENRLFPDLIRSHISNSEMSVRNPESTRPWQHVLDPLFGYLLAIANMQRTGSELSFNFGPRDSSLSVRQALEIAQLNWPVNLKLKDGVVGNLNLESKVLQINSDRANSILNWTPKWDQPQAIAKTMSWWNSVLMEGIDPVEATVSDIDDFLA